MDRIPVGAGEDEDAGRGPLWPPVLRVRDAWAKCVPLASLSNHSQTPLVHLYLLQVMFDKV